MSTQSKTEKINTLDSICDDHSNLVTRIRAISSLNKKSFHIYEAIVLVFEYIQLISQAFLLTSTFHQDPFIEKHFIYKAVIYAAKIMNPGFWFILNDYDSLTFFALICFVIFTIFKYGLFLYILIVVYKKLNGIGLLLGLWRLIFIAQNRILCYFTTSFWVQVIVASQNQSTFLSIKSTNVIILASFMFAFEYILSITLQFRYCYVLPAKNFLAAKDNYLEITTLIQKLIIQILEIAIPYDSNGKKWVSAVLNIVICLIRDSHLFINLPFYKFKALLYQGRGSVTVLTLYIACFFENVAQGMDYDTSLGIVLVIWIPLAIFAVGISDFYLKKIHSKFLISQRWRSYKFMVHKILAIKDLRRLKTTPGEYIKKYEFSHLMNTSIAENIVTILNLGTKYRDDAELNIHSKQYANKMFVVYLEFLCTHFPKNDFLKLFTAYYYAKKLGLFGIAMKLISELKKSSSYKIALSASLLILEIQYSVAKDRKETYDSIDLVRYLKSKSIVSQMKEKMRQQLEAQKDLYHEVLADSPNLAKIFKYSENVNKCRQQVEKKMKTVFDTIPEAYIRPLLVCSIYEMSLNHSVSAYLAYRKKYNHMYAKYEKFFRSDDLTKENLFEDDVVYVVVSGQKSDVGKILFSTPSIKKISGKEPHQWIGELAGHLGCPSVHRFYDQFYINLTEMGDQSLMGKAVRAFAWNKQGYMAECNFFLDIQPFMTQGFYLALLIRLIPPKTDYILLQENGDIESTTLKLAEKLGLLKSENPGLPSVVNIKSLCSDLKLANDAFNFVDLFEKSNVEKKEELAKIKQVPSGSILGDLTLPLKRDGSKLKESRGWDMSLQKAQELQELYTTTGKELKFISLLSDPNDNFRYTYHCKIENQFYGTTYLKLITLQEIEDPELEDRISVNKKKSLGHLQVPKSREIVQSEDYDLKMIDEVYNNNSANFELEDEKKSGWINFKTIDAAPSVQSPTIPFETIEEPLNSPLSLDALVPAPKPTIVRQRTEKNRQTLNHVISKSIRTLEDDFDLKGDQITKAAFVTAEGSVTSQKSKSTQKKKISDAFRAALSVKYSPGIFRLIDLVFLALLIVMFVTQLNLKDKLETAVVNLTTGKDIVSSAEDRNYELGVIMVMTRLVWDIGSGRVDPAKLGIYNNPAYVYAVLESQRAALLSTTNQLFLSNISLVEQGLREWLFLNDLKLYDTPQDRTNGIYTALNNFQAVDRIVETTFQVASILASKPVTAAKDQIIFLLENTVNDIYIKNEAISDGFMNFLSDEQTSINNTVTVLIIVTVTLFIGISVLLMIIIWRLYYTEKSYLYAVARLNTNGIQTALDALTHFKRTLENKENSIDRSTSIILGNDRRRDFGGKKKDKKEHLKVPNHTGIRNKYFFYTARLWLFIGLLVGLAIADSLVGKSTLTFFQQQQNQQYFTQRLKSQVTLLGVIGAELFAGNGTTIVYNEETADLIGDAIDELITMESKIASTYMRSNFTYDPQLSDILFKNGCPYITDKQTYTLCSSKAAAGTKTSLVYMVGVFENILKGKETTFETMDRSTEAALTAAQTDGFEEFITDYFIIIYELTSMTNIINQQFEDELSSSGSKRNTYFIVFTILLVVLGFLIWMLILNKLKNASQQFKIVLQAFPPGLILASFTLKSFLTRTSKGALDSIKNEI